MVDPETRVTEVDQEVLVEELAKCLESGHFMVAFYRLNGEDVQLYRMTRNFPTSDFQVALDLLRENLKGENLEGAG